MAPYNKSNPSKAENNQAGFTLVELAIVLVIIGLIVGGILVGQDLIKSAEIRATITQVERFNAGATAFRDKFGGLPGDLINTRATQFGLAPARTGTSGEGNGDGLIVGTVANPAGLIGETAAFWSDLSQAQLISQPVPALATMTTVPADASTLPPSRLRNFAKFHLYSDGGRNYFYLGAMTAVAAGTGIVTLGDGITPREAFAIDEKLDNGDGDEGVVIAVVTIEPNAEATNNGGAATDCFSTAAGLYNTDGSDADAINCRISIRTSF
jgi:prepilin-type N-terminal cleavage/methylation domain-containing protein